MRFLSCFLSLIIVCAIFNPASAKISNLKVMVDRVHCPYCALPINKELRKLDFIQKSAVNVQSSSVEIQLKEGKKFKYDSIKRAIEKAGFKAIGGELSVSGTIVRNSKHYTVLESSGDKTQFTPFDEVNNDAIVDDYLNPPLFVEEDLAEKIWKALKNEQEVFIQGDIHEHIGGTPLGILIKEIKFL